MGYYTSFTIYAERYHTNAVLNMEKAEQIEDTISDISQIEFGGDLLSGLYTYQPEKWYESTTDMIEVSRNYPGILFTVHGEGEEHDDIWDEYFLNGRFQHDHAEIKFEGFKEELLR